MRSGTARNSAGGSSGAHPRGRAGIARVVRWSGSRRPLISTSCWCRRAPDHILRRAAGAPSRSRRPSCGIRPSGDLSRPGPRIGRVIGRASRCPSKQGRSARAETRRLGSRRCRRSGGGLQWRTGRRGWPRRRSGRGARPSRCDTGSPRARRPRGRRARPRCRLDRGSTLPSNMSPAALGNRPGRRCG